MTPLTIHAASMANRPQTGEQINTNTVEGYYSIFKRGMIGVYQHCSEKHCTDISRNSTSAIRTGSKPVYNDVARADRALLGVKGKRLTYETTAQR